MPSWIQFSDREKVEVCLLNIGFMGFGDAHLDTEGAATCAQLDCTLGREKVEVRLLGCRVDPKKNGMHGMHAASHACPQPGCKPTHNVQVMSRAGACSSPDVSFCTCWAASGSSGVTWCALQGLIRLVISM